MRVSRCLVRFTAVVLALSTSPDLSLAQIPSWTALEELRLGNGNSIHGLPPIARLVVGRDGHAYALSRGAEILVFDRTGKLVRRVKTADGEANEQDLRERALERSRRLMELPEGARIQGMTVRSWGVAGVDMAMGWVGDTLWISRSGMPHVALFNENASGIGVIPFVPEIDGQRADAPLALLADRSLLRTITSSYQTTWPRDTIIRPPAEMYRMPVIPAPPVPRNEPPAHGFLLRATPAGQVLQGLEIFVQPRRPMTMENPYGATATIPFPFQDHPLVAVTPDGSEIIYVERYAAKRPDQATYSVARFDARTGKRAARPYSYRPAPITAATFDSIIDRLIDSAGSPITQRFLNGFPSSAAARRAILRRLDVATHHAPVTDVVAGADRTVWLREHATGSWLVIGRGGEMLGHVSLPADVRLLHADAETAWGLLERGAGESAVRTLVRYRLVKR